MPIGDLLAEITGGQPSSTPSPKSAVSSGVKRKAEDVPNGVTSTKLTKSRQSDGSYSSSKVTRDGQGRVVERSYSISRPVKAVTSSLASANSTSLPHRTSSPSTNGRYEPPTPTSQQRMASTSNGKLPAPSSNGTQQKRPSEASTRPTKLNQSALATAKVAPSKPSPTTPTTSGPSQAPKRGSFKEIMARGAKAQETMGKVGMIQHKPIDKAVIKKEREVTKPEQKPGMVSGAKGKTATSYSGSSRSVGTMGRDNGRPGASARDVSRNGVVKEVKTGSKLKSSSAADDVAEKKAKKSATATTGYAGTARPRPGAAANKGPSRGDQRPRHGGLLEPPRTSRRSHEDEYDEELDDFIDYDEEEEEDPRGRQYDYDSEGSSDMEAGLSDIDTEERRAELAAIEEDKREKALEEKLKREKEERKRRLAQGGR